MLEMSLSSKNEFLGLINVELFSQHLSKVYLKNFFLKRAKKGIHSRLIWPGNKSFAKEIIPHAEEYKIQIRYLPEGSKWSSGFISWNNYLSLKSFSSGKITCTIIKNEDIVSFYQEHIFNTLWQVAGNYSKSIE